MFDLGYGIPIYSAYYVTTAQAGQFWAVNRTGGWYQEKGIISTVKRDITVLEIYVENQ